MVILDYCWHSINHLKFILLMFWIKKNKNLMMHWDKSMLYAYFLNNKCIYLLILSSSCNMSFWLPYVLLFFHHRISFPSGCHLHYPTCIHLLMIYPLLLVKKIGAVSLTTNVSKLIFINTIELILIIQCIITLNYLIIS